jgi:HPt (histidine-containing phosphotransfer) domain-containing protein
VDGPENVIDFKYLEDFAAGDMRVVTEVLAMFKDQAQTWYDALGVSTEGWAATLHTMKGASRGVGAFALGEAAEQAERLGPSVLSLVRAELQAAIADIEGYLTRVGGG